MCFKAEKQLGSYALHAWTHKISVTLVKKVICTFLAVVVHFCLQCWYEISLYMLFVICITHGNICIQMILYMSARLN